jgi:hypothetical protein
MKGKGKKQKIKVTKDLKNEIVIILDRSGSMDIIRESIIDSFNSQVETIKKETEGMVTHVSLVTFSNTVDDATLWHSDLSNIINLTKENYLPGGMTALYDAVGDTITKLVAEDKNKDENTSYLLVIVSDGEENNSKVFNGEKIKALITECELDGRWTITYIGANQDLKTVASNTGIKSANTFSYQASAAGVINMNVTLNDGYKKYFDSRKMGIKSVNDLFSDK